MTQRSTPPTAESAARLLGAFDALVDLAPEQRALRLQELRAEDPELAHAVERMLRADGSATGLLDRGIAPLGITVSDALQHPGATVRAAGAGRIIGPFVLERLLGRGGMGEVWLATRSDGDFGQQVALKLLKSGLDSDDIVQRFVQERRILATLSHPNIARFIDGGMADDGGPWCAMEYVDGTTITEFARSRALDVRARVALIAEVAEAVAYAQTRLVVHRDLKPSNIMVDSEGRVHLLDFGIAKLLAASPDARETATGMRAMSPAYAAPEQILDQPISTATDVYALGVVLFELLTGSLPHDRSGGSLETLAEAVRHEAPERPSARMRQDAATTSTTTGTRTGALVRAAREVAGELDTIVLAALRREPERRYATAAAFADDLRRWLDGRPVAAQADTATYRMRKFIARHRLAVGSASAVLLALIAGFGTALWQAGVAREQARLAQGETLRAEREAALGVELAERTQRVKDFMMQTFVQADPLRRGSAAPTSVAEAFDAALARADTLSDDPKLQVDILDDFGEIRAGQGRIDEAIVLFDRAIELARSTWGDEHPVLAESLVNRGVVEAYRGRHSDGQPFIERAVSIYEKHAGERPLQYAHALSAMAVVHNALNQRAEALATKTRAVELFREHAKPGERHLAVALLNYGTMQFNYGDAVAAEPLVLEALSSMEALDGAQSPSLAPILGLLYSIRFRSGDLAGARAVSQRRLALVDAAFAGPHPWKAAALMDGGEIEYFSGEQDTGLRMLRESVAMMEAIGAEALMVPLRQLASFEYRSGRSAAANEAIERAHAFCLQRASSHLRCVMVRAVRAQLRALAGEADALSEAEAARAAVVAAGAEREIHYLIAQEAVAAAQRAAGLNVRARATLDEALALAEVLYGDAHPEIARFASERTALDR